MIRHTLIASNGSRYTVSRVIRPAIAGRMTTVIIAPPDWRPSSPVTMPGATMPFAIGLPNAGWRDPSVYVASDALRDHADAWEEAQKKHREATAKSIELLKGWLSPVQLEQYRSNGSFDVRGSDGGHYRIGPPSPFNIRVIEPEGHCGSAYCVVPKDISAAGDIQLAQKIALETDEEGTIRQANRANNSYIGWDGSSVWTPNPATD